MCKYGVKVTWVCPNAFASTTRAAIDSKFIRRTKWRWIESDIGSVASGGMPLKLARKKQLSALVAFRLVGAGEFSSHD